MKHRDAILALIDTSLDGADDDDARRLRVARTTLAGGSYTVLVDVGALVRQADPEALRDALAGALDAQTTSLDLADTAPAYDLPITPKRPADPPKPPATNGRTPAARPDVRVRSRALTITCPTCGAAPDAVCHDGDARACPPHKARRDAAGIVSPQDLDAQDRTARGKPRKRAPRPPIDAARVRDEIVALGRRNGDDGFSTTQLALALTCSKQSAYRFVSQAVKAGTLRRIGRRPSDYRYVYVDPRAAGGPTHKPRGETAVQAEVRRAAAEAAGIDTRGARDRRGRAQTVPGTGNSETLTRHRATRDLITEVERLGGIVEALDGGHLRVIGPSGSATIAKSPGSDNLARTRGDIRRSTGLEVRHR